MNAPNPQGLPGQLILAGALPFIAGTLALIAGVRFLPLLGDISHAVAIYALVIATFLTGIHWGQQLSLGSMPINLFISSNIIAVLIWLSWLILPVTGFLFFLIPVLAVMLIIDRSLCMAKVITDSYLRTRMVITAIVMLCLIITAVLS